MRFEHQLAEPGEVMPTVPSIMEPKWDGIRLFAEVHDDSVRFFTRSGNIKRMPLCEQELSALPVGTVLDGEAVCLTAGWGEAQSGVAKGDDSKLSFVVFDMLTYSVTDARSLMLSDRRALLERIFKHHDFSRVQLTPQIEVSQENHDLLIDMGFEGSVVKRKDARYACGRRGGGWWKFKLVETIDAVITGYEPGDDVGTILFSQYDEQGELVYVGRCKALKGSNENVEQRIAQRQVVEIKHNGVMPSGALRHAQIVRLRDDKNADACVLTQCLL